MKISALVVSVNYAAELAVTLPAAAKHLDHIVVVTDTHDQATASVAQPFLNVDLFRTEAFEANATCPFAKDRAIIEALRYLGPCGWTLLLDADILLPCTLQWPEMNPRCLYGARRRMCRGLTPADDWSGYPYQKDIIIAGYFQLFHSDCPYVHPWPNYPTERLVWYSDTIFQDRWAPTAKQWLPFDVLHIGDPPHQNWFGRSDEARKELEAMLRNPKNIVWKSKWKGNNL